MNQLIIFYLMTSATQIVPLVIVASNLYFQRPMPFLPKMPGDRSPLIHELQKIGISRFEQLSQVFDWDIRNYFARFSLVACIAQLIVTILIILIVTLGMSFPFIPRLDDTLVTAVMHELLMFSITTAVLHLLPKICLDLALIYGIPLPFVRRPPANRAPSSDEIAHGEENSEDFATIRVTRVENSEKIVYLAYCRDDRSGKVFKLVLCQGKEDGARPQCFMYTDDDESTLKQINPVPVSVDVLEEIFVPTENETNV